MTSLFRLNKAPSTLRDLYGDGANPEKKIQKDKIFIYFSRSTFNYRGDQTREIPLTSEPIAKAVIK